VFPTTGGVGTPDPSRITYRGTWLTPLIADAFDVRSDQITGPAREAGFVHDGPPTTVPSGGIGAPDAQGCPILPPNYQGMVGRPGSGEMC
jgi:hypothetical protein